MKGTKRKTRQARSSPSKRPKTIEEDKTKRKTVLGTSPSKRPNAGKQNKTKRKTVQGGPSPSKRPKTSVQNKTKRKASQAGSSSSKRPKTSEKNKSQSQVGKRKSTRQTSMGASVQRKTTKSTGKRSTKVTNAPKKGKKTAKPLSSGGPANNNNNKSSEMPKTYPDIDEKKTYDERFDIYNDDTCVDCHACDIGGGFECYIDENVRDVMPDDWQAVWKSNQFSYDVLVKVKQISFPHAKVELADPYCFQPNDLGVRPKNTKQQDKVQAEIITFLSEPEREVFLQELIPVDDGSGDLDDIADALELFRFFYSYLWHRNDDLYDMEYYWEMEHLEPRLKVYYDIKNNKASRTRVAEPYNRAMKAYHKKLWKYKFLKEKNDKDQEEEEAGNPRQMTQKEEDQMDKLWGEVCKSEEILDRITKYHNRPRMQWVYVGPGANLDDLEFF